MAGKEKEKKIPLTSICISCNAQTIERRLVGKRHLFYCRTCGKTNPYTFTAGGQTKEGKAKNGVKKHYGVGVIIKEKGKILVFDRTFFPFGWACVAGHVREGDTPEETARREVTEETGLKVTKLKKLFRKEMIGNRCSRGVSVHDWTVFEAKAKGKIKKGHEASETRWVEPKALAKLKLEPVWETFFKKLKYIK